MKAPSASLTPLFLFAISLAQSSAASAEEAALTTSAHDPGARAGSVGAGLPLATLSGAQQAFFDDGLARFIEVDSVDGSEPDAPGHGLGPGYNATGCGACHSQPSAGGTSPRADTYPFVGANPQMAAAASYGATNAVPSFVRSDGPVLETRFPFVVDAQGHLTSTRDGGVHAIYTIAGRVDAPGCTLAQPNYDQMLALGNLVFRIPTPVFGAGLIENIADATILANMSASASLKRQLGIAGHPNTSGNDGSIARFGWKAQNKSLEIFSGEAYNVEMGVSNELFPNERANPPAACMYNATPEDHTNFEEAGAGVASDTVAFTVFMRFLAPPLPSNSGIPGNPSSASIQRGRQYFSSVHCDLCHTPALQTAGSDFTSALDHKSANLYSDLLVHNMGSGLADNVVQGAAGTKEFRTAPLWGVGQRIFFLHDGRATPANGGLLAAIQQHASSGSEASAVIYAFNHIDESKKQDMLNFLRSL
jgi:CxxC motif-containing protein (DUF1111 family)